MIDFTDCKRFKKGYGGANGNKLCIEYEGEKYMLKFPNCGNVNKNMHYTNGCVSEYLGCHIFELVGIPVQKTLLGTYRHNNQDKLVVACKDLTSPETVLQDFGSLKNQLINSSRSGYGTDLQNVLQAIEEQTYMDPVTLCNFFWDMFIVDALIGNWDRHNGNWGFLYNQYTDEVQLAPVYDCGSALFPQADEEMMKLVLSDTGELHTRVYNRPLSALKIADKKINYFDFIQSGEYPEADSALLRIYPKLDNSKIRKVIDDLECLTDLQKEFYATMILARKDIILGKRYHKLVNNRIKAFD